MFDPEGGNLNNNSTPEAPGGEGDNFEFNEFGEVISGREEPDTRESLEHTIESLQEIIEEERTDKEEGLPGRLEDLDDELAEGKITQEQHVEKRKAAIDASQEQVADWQKQWLEAQEKLRGLK